MRRSSKINKKRRRSSSSLSVFVLIFVLFFIGIIVFYLNKKDGAVSSITRTREPSIVPRSTNINDNDENVGETLTNSGDELIDDTIILDVGDGITDNFHDDNDSESVLTWTNGPGANRSRAAETTETEPVAEQENEDSDVESYEANDMTAFHAIKHNNMRALRLLINSNADIYSGRNEMGYNAFHYAAHRLNIEAMEILLQYQNVFNVNSTSDNGNTALHIVAKRGEKYPEKSVAAAEFLLSTLADPNIADNNGLTPAFFAVIYPNFNLIGAFITYQVNAKYKVPGMNYNLLHVAMETCKRPIIKALIDYEPSLVNDVNYLNRLPIHEAAAFNCVDGLKELILTRRISKETRSPLLAEEHCRVEDPSECLFGATPLHFAAKFNNFEAVEFLLLIQSQLNSKNERNKVPFNYVPVTSALRTYLYEREDWEKRHPSDGQAEEELRDYELRGQEYQDSMRMFFRYEYLHKP